MHPDLEGGYEVHAWSCHACAEREAKQPDFKDAHGIKLAVQLTPEAQAYVNALREEA